MLSVAMGSVSRRSRLLLTVIAVPALSGCAALGLPDLPGSTLMPFGSQAADPSPAPDSSTTSSGPGYVASADGYSLSVPSGWTALDLSTEDGLALADAVASVDPTLGSLGRLGLEQSGARLSMVAVDLFAASTGEDGPGIVVATMRTRGMDKAAARTMVEELLEQAPLASEVDHTVVGLPAGDAHRYDAVIVGETVTLRLQVHVFRVGGDSFVVAAVAPEAQFDAARPAFDEVVQSLRFGV